MSPSTGRCAFSGVRGTGETLAAGSGTVALCMGLLLGMAAAAGCCLGRTGRLFDWMTPVLARMWPASLAAWVTGGAAAQKGAHVRAQGRVEISGQKSGELMK